MKANSSSRVSDLRATDLHISYPSLYQLSYDLMFSFLKLQYTWITTWMNWPLLRVTVAWWQNYRGSCSQNSTKVGGWERMGKRAARKNRAAAQGKFSDGVDRSPLSWLWLNCVFGVTFFHPFPSVQRPKTVAHLAVRISKLCKSRNSEFSPLDAPPSWNFEWNGDRWKKVTPK